MNAARNGPGPITWCGILAVTCLLLFLFQKILWLVVPFLLALVLYYLLSPLVKRMVLAGFSSDFAVTVLTGSFLLLVAVCLLLLYPWAAANADNIPAELTRHLAGGYSLVDSLLTALESKFAFIAKAHLSDQVRQEFSAMQWHFAERHLNSAVMTAGAWLPSLLLVPVIAFFLLKQGALFRKFLGLAVPNAYFEKTLYLTHAIDRSARLYFLGLFKIALIDMALLWLGFSWLSLPSPILLGSTAAILGQIPYVGPMLGFFTALLVAGTNFPGNITLAYQIIGLFISLRILDDVVFIPLIIGRSLSIHPLLSLLMLFIGGSIAGVAGLMLVLPMLSIVMLLGETFEIVLTDARLLARHTYAIRLRAAAARGDLQTPA
jgi:predicted PurR-regulated permease PerM